MKFLQLFGQVGDSSYYSFEFEEHSGHDVCFGDQIWSDGHEVEIADFVDSEALQELVGMVSNKTAFMGALRRVGFEFD